MYLRLTAIVCALCLFCVGLAGAAQSQTVREQKCCHASADTARCCCMPQQSGCDDSSAPSPCDDSRRCCPDALGTEAYLVTEPPVPGYRPVVVSVLVSDQAKSAREIASAPFIPPRDGN